MEKVTSFLVAPFRARGAQPGARAAGPALLEVLQGYRLES